LKRNISLKITSLGTFARKSPTAKWISDFGELLRTVLSSAVEQLSFSFHDEFMHNLIDN